MARLFVTRETKRIKINYRILNTIKYKGIDKNSVDFSATRVGGRRATLLFLIAQRTLPAGKHFLAVYLYTYQTQIRVPGIHTAVPVGDSFGLY